MNSTDVTYGVNPYQSVEGMVRDYEKQEAARDAACYDPDDTSDVPKEAMEPNRESLDYVRKGRVNPETGVEIPPTAKTRTAEIKQFGRVSEDYIRGYEQTQWAADGDDSWKVTRDDSPEHEMSADCWCRPELVASYPGGDVYVHNDFLDGPCGPFDPA